MYISALEDTLSAESLCLAIWQEHLHAHLGCVQLVPKGLSMLWESVRWWS